MVHHNKRIAATNKAQEPPKKKQKFSKADVGPHRSSALKRNCSTAKKIGESLTSTISNKNSSDQKTELPTNTNDNKPKLDTLPAEIQQQIYWLAIKDHDIMMDLLMLYTCEDLRSTTYNLACVSRAVEQHVLQAVEVWGVEDAKLCTKLIIHHHHHSLKRKPECDFLLHPWPTTARPCAIENLQG